MIRHTGSIIGKDFWRGTLSREQVEDALFDKLGFNTRRYGEPDDILVKFDEDGDVTITFTTHKNTKQE